MQRTSVREFFANRSILVTGGTGFMGKVLIEKLLRTCPEVHTVYVICRSKRSKTPTTRILEMSQLPLFQPLLEKYPDALKKVVAVDGDLTKPRMGMMGKCRAELIENVEIVFHLGASLRLEADLMDAVAANILGTKNIIELAKDFKKLKAFVHISTVFCQCEPPVVEEKIFKPDASPETVIALTEWIKNNKCHREITDSLLGAHPNCYTFTKQLAETLVDEQKETLPVCIVRPSIVTPTYRDPIPGWVDSLNGPIGILIAGGKGVLHSMMCGGDNQAQVIPCDIAINGIILAACKTAFERNTGITPVYNLSSGDFFPITYGTIFEKGMEAFFKYPCNPGLWYPDGSITTNKYVHNTKVFLFQIIPALLIDCLLFLCGQKPFMMRIQYRIKVGCEVLHYFTMRTWVVSTDHATSLHDYMSKDDQQTYFLSNVDLDIDRMMKDCILGTKQYCLKEPLSTLRSARIKLWIYWAVDRALKAYLLYQLYKMGSYLYGRYAGFDSSQFYSFVRIMDFYEKRDWYPDLEGLKVPVDTSKSEIRKLYKGTNIFITGGAGFLGSLLIEKIARSCPEFGKIYLLMRPKRGLTPSDRLNKVFEDEIYGTLKKVNPGFISKVMVIEGDLARPMCGLNKEDQAVLENEVNFVFHIAACLRMSEPLKSAFNLNIRATKDLLDLGTRMKHLKGFVYVSTAYSHCFRPDISETFYETEFTWEQLRDLVDVVSEEQLNYLTPKILGPWVNTYAFTKAISEYLVKGYVKRLPIAIARPSIVIGCVDEPLKNWINNVYGVTGVSAGACLGIIRVWYGDYDKVADIIPADYVVNTMIAISWKLASVHHHKHHIERPIYNIVSSPKSPTTWGEYLDVNARYAWESRLSCMEAIGEYSLTVVNRKWLYFLIFSVLHLGQGLILDTVLLLKGENPKLLKGYIRIMRFNQQLAFFGNREWIYKQENVTELLNEMANEDKQLFPFDMNHFNWRAYHVCTIKAVLKYIIKSNDVEKPAKAKLRCQKFISARKCIVWITQIGLLYILVKTLGRITTSYVLGDD